MKPIRIALIGVNLNSHSIQIHTRIQQLTDLFEVVGVAFPENEEERMPEKTALFSHLKQMTVEEIMADPTIEAVAVETDEIYCTKYALMAARAGKHVHMEKPGGRELEDFEEMISVIKEKNLIFCPGYMYRFNPYIQELFTAIEQGELGDIISVEAQMSRVDTLEDRHWMGQFKGGMMFYLGCHLIDLIYRIQGEPLRVHAFNCPTHMEGTTSEDYGLALLEYPNGVSFARTVAVERGGFRRRQLVVTGTKATWEIKPLEWGPESGMVTERNISSSLVWQHRGEDSVSPTFDRYNDMLTHFARCVRREQENEYTPDYELAMYRLFLRCCGA